MHFVASNRFVWSIAVQSACRCRTGATERTTAHRLVLFVIARACLTTTQRSVPLSFRTLLSAERAGYKLATALVSTLSRVLLVVRYFVLVLGGHHACRNGPSGSLLVLCLRSCSPPQLHFVWEYL